ncbi:unnamed protein product [Parnassius mnemosyne]|uniref:Metalloendopeptidase n=1 Tax=Parnassius mnemosyne TaxID=213953 RepID=A0AAV1LDA3_9NEOP
MFCSTVGLTLFYFTDTGIINAAIENYIDTDVIKTHHYVLWPDAVVSFYIDPEHFDNEQSAAITTYLNLLSYKTCLKFSANTERPTGSQHVMLFENPKGIRKCVFNTGGHSPEEPHKITLGYDCLKSPKLDMMVMRALGFPFEHNRFIRDLHIDVQMQNVEPDGMELFTKDAKLPPELEALPYDINSVTHFGERDYSKNGHRTILFKDPNVRQNRIGMSDIDIRKIEVVYGPECQKRDRQEKIRLCQGYPGVARKKREIDLTKAVSSLRVNREITAPPEEILSKDEIKTLHELGIGKEVQEIIEKVYKVSSIALQKTREKYCIDKEPNLRSNTNSNEKVADVLGIVKTVTGYVQSIVGEAIGNKTVFCEMYKSLDQYQRARCSYSDNDDSCRNSYRSTKSGRVQHSTQHRPTHFLSTKHLGKRVENQYERNVYRTGNNTEVTKVRRKRAIDSVTKAVASEGESDTTYTNNIWVRRKRAVNFASEIEGKYTNVESDDIKVRSKRSAATQPVTKASEPKGNTGNQSLNKEQKATDGVKLTNKDLTTTAKLNERTSTPKTIQKINDGKTNIKSLGRRRFQDSPFRVYNRKKNEEDKDESALSLETKQEEIIPKKVKEIKNNYLPQNKKKPVKNWPVVKRRIPERAPRKPKGPVPKTVKLSKANEEFYADRRWPDGVVRYIIKEIPKYDLEDMRSRLKEVNRILREKTCVRLEEITSDETNLYEDYLVLDNSPDYVTGRVGGRQNFGVVELFEGGQHRQHTAMMVMAMLGFYFEPSRHDRDRYVRVHPRHIRPDKLHHFEKLRPDATLPLPYDYRSATHPAWQFWRQLGRTGISAIATYKDQDPDGSLMKSLGHNSELLSDLDIIKINSVYGIECFL